MKHKKNSKVALQILFVAICVYILGGLSTIDTQAKAKKSYTVQFDKNGGKGKMSSKKYIIGKRYKLSKNKFTREGYVFVGWNTRKSGKGKTYVAEKKVKNLSTKDGATVKLYAKWKKGITVKFNADSGSVDTKSILVVKGKKYGSYAELPTATKPGYEFKGWYTKKKDGSKVTAKTKVKNKKKHTLYAQYNIIDYKINYNLDGGVNTLNPTTYTVATDSINLTTPTKNGYTFEGWYTDSLCTNKIDTIVKGTIGEVNLYAQWSLAKYTITYELNGGRNSNNNPDSYMINKAVRLKNPGRTGYTFEGWYTDSSFIDKISKIEGGISGNLKLYAKWSIDTYSIRYQLDDGTNDPTNPASYQIISDTITFKPASKNGYAFTNWTQNKFDDTKVSEVRRGSTGNVTLYANFEPIEYPINYELNGGTNNELNPAEYTIESKVIFRKPIKEGYCFEGFYMEPEFENQVTELENTYGEVTLYAKWEYTPITKAEWVTELVDTMDISISEDDLPKDMDGNTIYTFVDIADHEAAMKIEAAAAYGIIPIERDEEGGANYFDPDDVATREFVAVSSVMALGFETSGAADPDCTDVGDIDYKQQITVALNQEIFFKFDDNSFKPNEVVTVSEKDATLNKIMEIEASATVTETKNDSEYNEDVLHLNDEIEYDVSVNGATVSSNSVDAGDWTTEDEILVTVPINLETESLEYDNIIILPANDVFLSGLALKIQNVSVGETEVTLTCSIPEDLSEVLTRIDVSGIAQIDGSKVVGAEGVEAVYNPNGVAGIENLDHASVGVDIDGSASMPGTISFTFKDKKLSDKTKINGKIEVGIPDISYRLDAGVTWGGVYVDDLYLAITEEMNLVGEMSVDLHGSGIVDEGAIEIGRAPFPLGPGGLTVDVVFWFNYNVGGSASIKCSIENTNGIQMIKGDLRVINDVDGKIEADANSKLEVGPKLSLMLTMFSVFDLVDITADGGVGVTAAATSRTPQITLTCYDIGAYLYLKVSAGENSIIGDLLNINYSWDIFNKDTSPLKKMWHYEDSPEAYFHKVLKCTFGEGTIKGTVVDAETNQKVSNGIVKIYAPSGILTKVLYTDSKGQYETDLYPGKYKFVISARGYMSYQDNYSVLVDQTTYLEASLMVDKTYVDIEESTTSGKILDSVTGYEVNGATLNIRKGWNQKTGDILQTLATDRKGN